MILKVNGKDLDLPAGATVRDLLARLELPPDQVAVERNGALVRRADHERTVLEAGDALEVVTLVGGG